MDALEQRSKSWYFLDGNWVRDDDMKISVHDIAFLRGLAVFDFLRTYDRKPFTLADHVTRLLNSARLMGLLLDSTPNYYTREGIEEIVHEGIRKNPHLPELYIKLYFTGGASLDGYNITAPPTFAALFLPAGTYPAENYTQGLKITTMKYERFLPRIKSTSYMAAIVGSRDAKAKGAHDALFITTDGKHILEGTTQNFFGVMDNKLYTAKDGMLEGITRKVVLQLAEAEGIPAVVDVLPTEMIPRFQEAFITSTTREITPIVKVDDLVIGDGSPGPITKRLMAAFKKATTEL